MTESDSFLFSTTNLGESVFSTHRLLNHFTESTENYFIKSAENHFSLKNYLAELLLDSVENQFWEPCQTDPESDAPIGERLLPTFFFEKEN